MSDEANKNTSAEEEETEYLEEPALTRRHTSSAGATDEDDDDDDDIMPEPSLTRATSAPTGESGLEDQKSPFQRQKRRVGRKSLRQQNPNHILHSLLPEDMQETEETDEVSALARAREKRKEILAKRNSQTSDEDIYEDSDDQEKVEANETQHIQKDSSVASFASPTSAGPLTPASTANDLPTPATTTQEPPSATTGAQEKPKEAKKYKNLDQFFAKERHKKPQNALPPTPPSSPLQNRMNSTRSADNISVAEESLLPYASNEDAASVNDLTSLDGNTTVASYGTNGALLKGYQEKLSKQLSELHQLCEQDNHIDDEEGSHKSTFTNPDDKEDDDDDDDDDSASENALAELLKQVPPDLGLTGRSFELNEQDNGSSIPVADDEDDDASSDSSGNLLKRIPKSRSSTVQEAPEQDKSRGAADQDEDASLLQQMPPDLRLTGRSVSLQEEGDGNNSVLSQSERLDVEGAGAVEEDEEEPASTTNAAPTPQMMDREISKQEEKEETDQAQSMPKEEEEAKNKALSEEKTPKRSNLSNPKDDDDESLEDLYRGDQWGKADTKGEDDEVVVDEEDSSLFVSTTAKVVVATVAIVAGFCMRTFGRHR